LSFFVSNRGRVEARRKNLLFFGIANHAGRMVAVEIFFG